MPKEGFFPGGSCYVVDRVFARSRRSTKSHGQARRADCVFFGFLPTVGFLHRPDESMIRSLVTALFWLSFPVPVAAQPRAPKPIELTAEIISQSYCSVNADTSSLQIRLKLRYRNVGKQKLILYNGHDLFYQTKIRSAPGNVAGPHEVWVVNSRYFDEEVEAIDQTSPGKVFMTLAPGAIHSREIVIGLGLVSGTVDRDHS